MGVGICASARANGQAKSQCGNATRRYLYEPLPDRTDGVRCASRSGHRDNDDEDEEKEPQRKNRTASEEAGRAVEPETAGCRASSGGIMCGSDGSRYGSG